MAARLIICAVLALACALLGRSLAGAALKKANEIQLLQEDIARLRMLCMEKRMPLSEALKKLNTQAFVKMSERMRQDALLPPARAWKALCAKDSAEAEAVYRLFEAIDGMSRQENEKQYARCERELMDIQASLRREGAEKLRLYTRLGALLGLSAGIMLL